MSLTVNLAQINSAANGNVNDLRETLTALHLAVQSLYAGATAPLKKVDAKATANLGPPAQCGLAVSGANGSFTVNITLPQQAGGSTAPGNASNAPIYQEISSSTAADFSANVRTYPLSVNTSFNFPNPGATLYWRLRSSYDQKTWNSYSRFNGAVSAGLQSSGATQPNLSLNKSNFATVDSVAAGATASVRAYGTAGGVGTSWPSIIGSNSTVVPAGTIMNVPYGVDNFVSYDGSRYQLSNDLPTTFPDHWIPVGFVSVIGNGAGLTLPVIHPVISSGAIIAYNVVSGGNDITGPLSFVIFDSGGGTGATVGAQSVSGGVLQSLAPGNPGSGYSGATTVTPGGGISGGVGGGGGANGNNGGRIFGLAANGT